MNFIIAAAGWDWLLDILKQAVFWLFGVIQLVGATLLDSLAGLMTYVLPLSYVNTFQTTLQNIDFFFPLRETITFGSAYFILWAALALYRLIKSFIPAIAT